ncbi:hypothetical protein ACFV2Z_30330 [Streptomyces sp. NPDC059688]|uniref:Uncharacterized protein n=1 Tax=Streptomyces albidocamelliae TaxID=2981135 RepID=A0ABY6EHA7_9ACTN|nr:MULTISPECIES: hypothetical protein [unclassified Streptomyces]UXY33662.1 hypothetical protein N8I86_02260 [Streptomyces sp. HUAS 14-6]
MGSPRAHALGEGGQDQATARDARETRARTAAIHTVINLTSLILDS